MKLLALITLVASLVVSALAQDKDQVVLYTAFKFVNGQQYRTVYAVRPERWFQVPIWEPDTEAPPLSITKAVEIARKWSGRRSSETRLQSYQVQSHNQRWFYKLYFEPLKAPKSSEYETIVVLMDGAVVLPSEAPATVQTPQQK